MGPRCFQATSYDNHIIADDSSEPKKMLMNVSGSVTTMFCPFKALFEDVKLFWNTNYCRRLEKLSRNCCSNLELIKLHLRDSETAKRIKIRRKIACSMATEFPEPHRKKYRIVVGRQKIATMYAVNLLILCSNICLNNYIQEKANVVHYRNFVKGSRYLMKLTYHNANIMCVQLNKSKTLL